MTFAEIEARIVRCIDDIDDGLQELARRGREAANTQHAYRKAKASAFLAQGRGTIPERSARADLSCAVEQREAELAEALKLSALEVVRSRRGQLSALQSLLAGHRAEAEFVRTGPYTKGA